MSYPVKVTCCPHASSLVVLPSVTGRGRSSGVCVEYFAPSTPRALEGSAAKSRREAPPSYIGYVGLRGGDSPVLPWEHCSTVPWPVAEGRETGHQQLAERGPETCFRPADRPGPELFRLSELPGALVHAHRRRLCWDCHRTLPPLSPTRTDVLPRVTPAGCQPSPCTASGPRFPAGPCPDRCCGPVHLWAVSMRGSLCVSPRCSSAFWITSSSGGWPQAVSRERLLAAENSAWEQ